MSQWIILPMARLAMTAMVSTTTTAIAENASAPSHVRSTTAEFSLFVSFLLWSASVLLRSFEGVRARRSADWAGSL
ncbi:MAG: hypothetical protein HN798_07610 [Chloroflexi bacterium]|nr:hypothetical protein [Chloroflexota bacterium]